MNPHRDKRIEKRTPIPLVDICPSEICNAVESMGWDVLENMPDGLSWWDIQNWIQRSRKISKSWFSKGDELQEFLLGFRWTNDDTGRTKFSYWLEYSIVEG